MAGDTAPVDQFNFDLISGKDRDRTVKFRRK
ncbi:MAG: hypothetical protein ACI89J_000796 [Hyphomicrobiaceae bacterium]|jgi:hypothetical protein